MTSGDVCSVVLKGEYQGRGLAKFSPKKMHEIEKKIGPPKLFASATPLDPPLRGSMTYRR